jgi:hypothetical protein
MDQVGKAMAMSGLFGAKNESQGRILAASSWINGTDPVSTQNIYHIVSIPGGQAKLSKRADAVLAELRAAGGDFEIVERTPDRAAIKVTWQGVTEEFELTWIQARQEPFVYAGPKKEVIKKLATGQQPEIQANYATPRSRMQMLWARVSTDSIRAMAPELICGFYPAEILKDLGADENEIVGLAEDISSEVVESVSHSPAGDDRASGSGLATEEQMTTFANLFSQLGGTIEQAAEIYTRMGVKSMAELTEGEAQGLIDKLHAKWSARDAESAAAGDPETEAPSSPEAKVPGQCGSDQVEMIRALFTALEVPQEIQTQAIAKRGKDKVEDLSEIEAANLISSLQQKADQLGVSLFKESLHRQVEDSKIKEIQDLVRQLSQDNPDLATSIRAKLVQHGLEKIADLSDAEADRLLGALRMKELDKFFSASLEGWSKKD